MPKPSLLFVFCCFTLLLHTADAQESVQASTGTQLAAAELRMTNADGAPLTAEADSRAKVGEEGLRLIRAADAEATLLNSPVLLVEGGKRYKIRFHLLPEAYESGAELDLLVREHAEPGKAPLQPYHKIGLADRVIADNRQGKWITRHLVIPTREETQALSATLIVRGAPATIVFGGFDVTPGEIEQEAVQALLDESRQLAATRQRVAERTLVMPRSQLKYGMDRNYLHWWQDRPLFVDRAARDNPLNVYALNRRTMQREVETARLYGLDGLASLTVSAGQLTNYLLADQHLTDLGIDDFIVYPEYWGAGDQTDKYFDQYAEALQRALASPHSFRVGGKPVITSYIGDGWTPSQMKAVLDRLRQRFGDTFLFVADIRRNASIFAFQNGELATDDILDEKARLRDYLDVADGIMFMGANHVKLYYTDPDYGDSINIPYLRDYIATVFKSVLAEEPYRAKLLGLSACVGYVNPRSSAAKREDRTRALRHTLEVAINADPDFIGMPEWNEFNENTSVCPTVYRGLSSQRIMRYYLHRMRGLAPTPNPGDNTAIPNLVLSYRRVLKLGEILRLELLNIPDGVYNIDYSVQLDLHDAAGNLVKSFPAATFTGGELHEITYDLPTDEFPRHRVLSPTLVLTVADQEPLRLSGFLHARLHATWNWNYLCVKQPIRDLPQPALAELSVNAMDREAGTLTMRADYRGDAPLASLELLENGQEIWAHDPANEFDLANNHLFKVSIIRWRPTDLEGTIAVRDGTLAYARPVATDNMGSANADAEAAFRVDNNTLHLRMEATRAWRAIYLTVPRTDTGASLHFDLDPVRMSVPLADVVRLGEYARTFPNQLMVQVERFDKLADVPVRFATPQAQATFTIRPQTPHPIYHLRAITTDGKIHRSPPLIPTWTPSTDETLTLPFFSDSRNGNISAELPVDQLPDLNYRFEPTRGDFLATPAGRRWRAELGGGLHYGAPFNRGAAYPSAATESAPEWIQEDNTWCLRFDGLGTYITFPHETLPRGAFQLDFEVKPAASIHPQVLFRSYGMGVGSLLLKLQDGKLIGAYTDEKRHTHLFDTELQVTADAWSSLSVTYDLSELTFRVNDTTCAYPFSHRPFEYQPCVFGGHTRAGNGVEPGDRFYEGLLRAFRIRHYVPAQ